MITVAELRELVAAEIDVGTLTWRERPESMFPLRRTALAWNRRYAGRPALNATDERGYLHGRIFNRKYYAHRVLVALSTGEWPKEVDHINGDVTDNRQTNLRAVTHQENGRNQRCGSSNKSGVRGIHWSPRRGVWCAQIGVDMRRIGLGEFVDKESAIAARKEAERKYGFHTNHGRKC